MCITSAYIHIYTRMHIFVCIYVYIIICTFALLRARAWGLQALLEVGEFGAVAHVEGVSRAKGPGLRGSGLKGSLDGASERWLQVSMDAGLVLELGVRSASVGYAGECWPPVTYSTPYGF